MFAFGAIKAGEFIVDKGAGLYQMSNLFND
jgi:dihydrodipicolinate reductase